MKLPKNQFIALGLMSGTSMDGVDCALINSDGISAKAMGYPVHMAYSPDLRHEISQAMEKALSLGHPSEQNGMMDGLTRTLTLVHGQAVEEILRKNNLKSSDIDIIGFHGQTLAHRPDRGWSWQIGDGQLLANITRIPVVNDFRRQDVEGGGQGAPLVPVYHRALMKNRPEADYPVAIINIGGVGNITWIGGGDGAVMLAFDTGPGNAFLDDWVKQHTGEPMDRDGVLAAKGQIDHDLVGGWMSDPYFLKTPPKSLDRRAFDIRGIEKLSLIDGAATLLEFTVKSIGRALDHCPEPPGHIYICGGGRHNKFLMSKLGRMTVPLDNVETLGWHGDYLEAEAFAFLACRHQSGLPITFPETTGISAPATGGKLFIPEN